MKLGILGGSFNPIHLGHLAMAGAAMAAHGLDRVIFIPAGSPPHKRLDLAPAADRLEMVRLAIRGREGFEASGIEVERPGRSYTVDTLEKIAGLHPDAELFFILGEDSLLELPGWREPERILRLARVAVVNRPGSERVDPARLFPRVAPGILERIGADRVDMPPSPIDSTRIREDIRAGRSVADRVPPAVAAYIRERSLYR